jgi:hypothetical protein
MIGKIESILEIQENDFEQKNIYKADFHRNLSSSFNLFNDISGIDNIYYEGLTYSSALSSNFSSNFDNNYVNVFNLKSNENDEDELDDDSNLSDNFDNNDVDIFTLESSEDDENDLDDDSNLSYNFDNNDRFNSEFDKLVLLVILIIMMFISSIWNLVKMIKMS